MAGVLEAETRVAPGTQIEQDPRWQATLRVTRSPHFAKAARLSSFLLYVSRCALEGRVDEVSEQQIGVHVFDKPPTYNASDDTIVRATARQLRQRLAVYYQEEGRSDLLQITIPRGGYLPLFTEVVSAPTAVAEPQLVPQVEVQEQPVRKRARASIFLYGLLAGVLLTGGPYVAYQSITHRSTPSDRLWTELFNSRQQTLIVVGDAGLNLFENLSRQQVGLDEYASRSYMQSPSAQTPAGYNWDPLASRTYTTVQDLTLTARLEQLPQAQGDRTSIRFARDLSMDDIKGVNLILLGAPQYDPWEQLFERDLNFTVHYDGASNTITVLNHNPQPSEKRAYTWDPGGSNHIGYALLTLTDNTTRDGKVLLVQGTTAAGNDAAGDFLLDPHALGRLLQTAEDRAGHVRNFQVLLETTMMGGSSHSSRILAQRIWSTS